MKQIKYLSGFARLFLSSLFQLRWPCQRDTEPSVLVPTITEGLRAKRAYIAFLANFHFLQDRANFWQTDLF